MIKPLIAAAGSVATSLLLGFAPTEYHVWEVIKMILLLMNSIVMGTIVCWIMIHHRQLVREFREVSHERDELLREVHDLRNNTNETDRNS